MFLPLGGDGNAGQKILSMNSFVPRPYAGPVVVKHAFQNVSSQFELVKVLKKVAGEKNVDPQYPHVSRRKRYVILQAQVPRNLCTLVHL